MSFPRYESYKDSGIEWLGEVPKHWQHASLRHACRRITDGSHFSPKSVENGKSYVTVRNLDCRKIDLLGAAKVSPEDFEKLEKAGCRPAINDVLFSKDGTVGKVAIVEDDNFVALSSLAIISPMTGKLAPKFLFYFLQSANGEKQIESLYAGAALRRITLDAIVGIWLPLPELPEQSIIAAFLDRETAKIDALIAEQQRLIELLKEKRQSVISHAVTKGLNPNAPMKDSGIEWLGEVPEHWEVISIKWLSPVQHGASPRPIDDPKYFDEDGEYAWVRIADVSASDGVLRETTQKLSVLGSSLSVKIAPGELFVSIAGTVGKPCISEIKACIHDGFVYFPRLKINPKLLYRIFESGTCYGGLGKWGTQLNLNTDTIGSIRMALPPQEELDQVLTFLDRETAKIDTLTAEAKAAIALLQERRTALISAAVTGKIDVRSLVTDKS